MIRKELGTGSSRWAKPKRTLRPNSAHCPPPPTISSLPPPNLPNGAWASLEPRRVTGRRVSPSEGSTQLPKWPGSFQGKAGGQQEGCWGPVSTSGGAQPSSLGCNWEPVGSSRHGPERVPLSVSLHMRPVKPSGQRQWKGGFLSWSNKQVPPCRHWLESQKSPAMTVLSQEQVVHRVNIWGANYHVRPGPLRQRNQMQSRPQEARGKRRTSHHVMKTDHEL